MRNRNAFTLIELLIVVAIIAILAAIAVPNFLEAQTRAKVSRVKNDLRTFSVAFESYRVDNNKYPCYLGLMTPTENLIRYFWTEYLAAVTTPISYLSSVTTVDPFQPDAGKRAVADWQPDDSIGSYFFVEFGYKNVNRSWGYNMRAQGCPDLDAYFLSSYGPDRIHGSPARDIFDQSTTPWTVKAMASSYGLCDPTNGTVSFGDIPRWGGAAPMTTIP